MARYRAVPVGLLIIMTACSGGTGIDLGCPFCSDQPPATITVDAGQDRTAITGDMVVLSGTDNASDGCFATYTWTQSAGPAVQFFWAPHPHQTAEVETPLVDVEAALTFTFTGTCANGATDADAVTIQVQPTSATALCVTAPLFATSYAWSDNGCVTDPTDIAGDSRVATVYRQSEVEPNNSMQSASALTFPAPLANERVATDIAGSVRSGGDLPWDGEDFFIFTPMRSGVYNIYLCNDPLVCMRGTVTERWFLTLSDQNFRPMAGTTRGSIVEQTLQLSLEAGVSYYIGVETFVSPSEWDYNLTIISEGT